ncbi:MAG: SLAC1 anion channel family protein [Patescibacteria group bacterium]
MKKECRIKFFPVSFFSVILGMAGFTIAFQRAEEVLGMPFDISWYLLIITSLIFLVITVVYALKIFRFKEEVRVEFNDPVKLSFFPTFSISLLLLSIAFLGINVPISKYLWIAGSAIHLIFTIKIISIWIQHTKFEVRHMNPAWFIPAVGNILVPVAGVAHFSNEISWFFYSIGFFFWVALFIIFFNRIIFHSPLPQKLLPTLFILIAPPAIGFISFVKLTGDVSEFSKILYYIALFLVIMLFAQIKMFGRIKYYLSWWAYSFPMTAITIASILMFHETDIEVFKYLSWLFFVIVNIIIVILLTKTVVAISKKEICIEEE